MSKHFTSIIRLLPCNLEGEQKRLEVTHSKSSKTISLPGPSLDQPRPHLPATPVEVSFTFDEVFSESQHQSAVYKQSIRGIVDNVLTGYNGTVISLSNQEANDIRNKALKDPVNGAIQKASQQIFRCLMKSRKNQAQACSNLIVLCSYVIVVCEKCHDLLAGFSPSDKGSTNTAEKSSTQWPVLQFADGVLKGASQHKITTRAEMAALLKHAVEMEKKVLETYRTGRVSTHSDVTPLHHTVCTIGVEYAQFGTMSAPISGTLSLVEVCPSDILCSRSDLAKSSEETISLFAFADIIESLVKKPSAFVLPPLGPSNDGGELYKKSALIQLLKESLGGNCKTLLLLYVTKQFSAEKYSQMQSLLSLASQARLIKNSPNKKDLAEKALLTAYMRDLHKRYGEDHDVNAKTSVSVSMSPTRGMPGNNNEDEEERQYKMEMAASALVAAVGRDGGMGERDSDSWSEDEDEMELQPNSLSSSNSGRSGPKHTRVKIRRKSTRTSIAETPETTESETAEDISVDALITILQDPDTGVPRPSVATLKDVKLRTDIGAIFSGAAIVAWTMENVAGVESEEQAVALGQLLLDKEALIHSEGSMVFANAETLFYYAKKGRPSRRTLSQEEILALLTQARISSTEVDPNHETGKRGKKKGRIESIHTIHEVNPELERKESMQENNFLLSSAGFGIDEKEGATTRIHQIDNETELFRRELKNEGGDVANRSTSVCESTDSVITQSNPNTPTSISGGGLLLTDEAVISHTGQATPLIGNGKPQEEQADGHSTVLNDSWSNSDMGVVEEEAGHTETDSGDPNTTTLEEVPTLETLEKAVNYPHPLHEAVAIGKAPGVIQHLVMMFGVNKLDDSNRTPLMFAALGNNKKSSCSTLIDCGAGVNLQDVYGLTALHIACYHGHKSAANVLLNKGALPEILDSKSHSALHWSTVPESDGCLKLLLRHTSSNLVRMVDVSGLTALHWAIHFKRPHHLTLLLQKYGDPTHLDTKGRTFVTYALQKQSLECVKVLISVHPSLLTFPDASKSTPLHHASAHSTPKPLLLLLSPGLKSKEKQPLPINSSNSYKRTPLHCAVAYNSQYNADLLLKRGADLQLCDSEGKTPLDYAKDLDNSEDMLAILEGRVSFDWSKLEGEDGRSPSSAPSHKDSISKICIVS